MSTDIVKSNVGMMTFQEMDQAADAIAKSGLFGMKRKEEVLALGLLAQAEGRPFAIVARDYHIISGRPALKADAILTRFQEAGGSIKWLTFTDQECKAEFKHPQGGELVLSWDMARAKQARLTTDMWSKYPRQMLKARVISDGVRAVYPAALSGCYTPEEVQDFVSEEPKNITAEVTVTPKAETVQTAPVAEVAKPAARAAKKTAPAPAIEVKSEVVQETTKPAETPVVTPTATVEVKTPPPVVATPVAAPALVLEAQTQAAPAEKHAPLATDPDNTKPLLDESVKTKIIQFFAAFDITPEILERYVGIRTTGWNLDTKAMLNAKYSELVRKVPGKLEDLKSM